MQFVFDETGRLYLDALAGIVTVSVGHCHPHVVEAANRQNETLQHSTTIICIRTSRNMRSSLPLKCRAISRPAIS